MLISFNIKNWMSFRDEASFSMVASKERQHGDRLPKIPKYQMRLLPVSALYGGNASGKTNLFKAIEFAREFIVRGTEPEGLIPVQRFKLSESGVKEPAEFSFVLLIDEMIYEYAFSVSRTQVFEEKLTKITSRSEWVLYHRTSNGIEFDENLPDENYLEYAFRGTRDNQLFLTNAVSQKVDTFKPVHDWFKNTLKLITPRSKFAYAEQFIDENNPLYRELSGVIEKFDTGILKYGWINLPFESISLPPDLKAKVEKLLLKSSKHAVSLEGDNDEQYNFVRVGENIEARKLVTFHKSELGEIRFELNEESDGSRRVLDLLPAFIDLKMQLGESVYVIDELDRSLHTQLTRSLLEYSLASCTHATRSQLMFTTHDAMLMDQSLFRRDEMWVTERNENGESTLIPFSDFKNVRYDKDLRKSYLEGRMGGVPHINLPTLKTQQQMA